MKRSADKNDNVDKKDKASAVDADAEDFAREMADVVRLEPDPRGRVRATSRISPPRAETQPKIRRAALSGSPTDSESSADDAFVAPGVDRRELRKLRRGDHAPGNRLDLHGVSAEDAVASVKRFIDSSRHRHRCICIVHGRGLHSEGNVSILKTRVRDYLRQHPAVLAYSDAPRADGGSGAVYVLLRR